MNVFIEDINKIKDSITNLEKKIDEILKNTQLLYVANSALLLEKKEKKRKRLLNNFTYSSSSSSEYTTDSDCDVRTSDIKKIDNNCGCGKEPQKEDKEISAYIKRLMQKKEENNNDSCDSCGFDYKFD